MALRRFTEGVFPKGSTWSVLEVPNCVGVFGTCVTKQDPQYKFDGSPPHPGAFEFPPKSPGLYTDNIAMESGISPNNPGGKGSKWTYNDNVKVPSDLPAGRYVLGWRW